MDQFTNAQVITTNFKSIYYRKRQRLCKSNFKTTPRYVTQQSNTFLIGLNAILVAKSKWPFFAIFLAIKKAGYIVIIKVNV